MKKTLTIISVIIVVGLAFYLGTKSGNEKVVPNVYMPAVATSTTEGIDNDGMEDEHAFLQADYNFDGHADRLALLDCGATGNCTYEVDLYNSETKTYMPVIADLPKDLVQEPGADGEVSFEVTNPVVNKEEKLVCSYANVGAGSYHLAIYTYSAKENTYTQVKEFSGSTDKIHKCGLK